MAGKCSALNLTAGQSPALTLARVPMRWSEEEEDEEAHECTEGTESKNIAGANISNYHIRTVQIRNKCTRQKGTEEHQKDFKKRKCNDDTKAELLTKKGGDESSSIYAFFISPTLFRRNDDDSWLTCLGCDLSQSLSLCRALSTPLKCGLPPRCLM